MLSFFNQIHGYKNGHQLISADILLSRIDQDTIDRLSDISGPLKPGETFQPYLTCYPLPSNEYFVIAKTWQDLKATRAGCVQTKSFLISMSDWELTKNVAGIFHSISNLSSVNDELTQPYLVDNFFVAPVIPLAELTDAIFLDQQRSPVVVFNAVMPEAVVARLYSVFWKSMKMSFSTCTFALSQRSINGKLFDLLFAPSSAKTKFAEWPGRRIDGGNIAKPRHRWANELSENIFLNATPSLFDNNTNSFINFDPDGNESTLRLNLLWNELLEKAENESSPFAILGLLDIINSQPIFATELYQSLKPYILNSIQTARQKLTVPDAWTFYSALLAKHKKKLMGREMLDSVRNECVYLTETQPNAAIDFIENYPLANQIPSILYAAIGDGLCLYIKQEENWQILHHLTNQVFVSLLAFSKNLSAILLERQTSNSDLWIFDGVFKDVNSKITIKAKKNLASNISFETNPSVLDYLFENCDLTLFKYILVTIGKSTAFSKRSFDEVIVENTIKLHAYDFLAEILVTYDKDGAAKRLMLSAIQGDPNILRAICLGNVLSDNRKLDILEMTLTDIPFVFDDIVFSDYELSNVILQLLSRSERTVKLYAYILVIADIQIEEAITKLISLPIDILSSVPKQKMIFFLLKTFLDGNEKNYGQASILFNNAEQIDPIEILERVTSSPYSIAKISNIIKSILTGGVRIQQGLTRGIDHVSYILASNPKIALDNDIEIAWAKLLINSASDSEKQNKAAVSVLDFAYGYKKNDPTELIIAAFPVIYNTFLKGNSVSPFFMFAFFSDWDRCRTLRMDLVTRYMNSNWSRFGLFRVAAEAHIMGEVTSILFSIKGGKKFLQQAIAEAAKSHLSEKDPVMRELHMLTKK